MVPAAALTAFAREGDKAHALSAGFQMHLAKPIDAATLVAAVAELARSRPLVLPQGSGYAAPAALP